MHIYIYTHMYVYTHILAITHIYTHTWSQMCVYIYLYLYTPLQYIYISMYICVYIYTYTNMSCSHDIVSMTSPSRREVGMGKMRRKKQVVVYMLQTSIRHIRPREPTYKRTLTAACPTGQQALQAGTDVEWRGDRFCPVRA